MERVRRLAERQFSFGVVGAVSTILAIFATSILPTKYFNDAKFIEQISSGTNVVVPDPTFESTGQFYRISGLAGHPALIAVVTMIVFLLALRYALGADRISTAKGSTLGIAYASIVLCAIYVATYSKEFIVLIAVAVVMPLSKVYGGLFATVGFMCIYALFFRQYWLLVAALTVVGAVIWRRSGSISRQLLTLLIGLAVAAVAVKVGGAGPSLNSLREKANIGRVGASDARTIIQPYVGGEAFVAGYANAFITFFLLLFPIPLVLLLSPQYLAAAAFLSMVACRGSRAIRVIAEAPRESSDARQAKVCLVAAFALIIVQSVYVPDYGSALKHFTPIMPLIVFGLLCADRISNDLISARPVSGEDIASQPSVRPTSRKAN